METLVERGKVKSIGISNFTITKTDKLLKTAKIIPAVNQGTSNTLCINNFLKHSTIIMFFVQMK